MSTGRRQRLSAWFLGLACVVMLALPGASAWAEGVVRIEAFVGSPGADFVDTPVASARVMLHVVAPPHELVRSVPGVTDESGRAVFEEPVHPEHEAYLELRDGPRQFSDAIPLRDAGRRAIALRTLPVTSDPSTVFASRVIVLLEPWENFVIVQQVWTLNTEDGSVYRADTTDPGPGMAARLVRLPLPEGAKGVQVLEPVDGTRVMGSTVFFGGEVRPATGGTAGATRVILQYSLPLESAALAFEQPIAMFVRNLSVVVPRTSRHERHARLNVDLDVPLCADGAADGASVVCFAERTTDTSGMNVNLGADVLVARGAVVQPGQVLRVETRGWPFRFPWERWAGGTAGAAGLLLALGAVLREACRRRQRVRVPGEVEREAIEFQIASLIEAARHLAAARERGELLADEFDDAIAQLHERLGVLYRRRRELAPPASDAPC